MPKGEKTKELWLNPKYKTHMGQSHKGQKAWNKTQIFINCFTCKERVRIPPSRIAITKYCSRACYGKSLWKGDKVGYSGLHKWVQNQLGKAKRCEFNLEHKGKFEWANKSHKYKRILSDWLQLCNLCHQKYDSKTKKIWK